MEEGENGANYGTAGAYKISPIPRNRLTFEPLKPLVLFPIANPSMMSLLTIIHRCENHTILEDDSKFVAILPSIKSMQIDKPTRFILPFHHILLIFYVNFL